jgi:hypothetical protein
MHTNTNTQGFIPTNIYLCVWELHYDALEIYLTTISPQERRSMNLPEERLRRPLLFLTPFFFQKPRFVVVACVQMSERGPKGETIFTLEQSICSKRKELAIARNNGSALALSLYFLNFPHECLYGFHEQVIIRRRVAGD